MNWTQGPNAGDTGRQQAHAKPVQAWLAEDADAIEVFYLPGYSPELNRDEMANADIKQAVTTLSPARTTLQRVNATALAALAQGLRIHDSGNTPIAAQGRPAAPPGRSNPPSVRHQQAIAHAPGARCDDAGFAGPRMLERT